MSWLVVCGGPDICPTHGTRRYAGLACHHCQQEWAESHPLHAEATTRFVRGEITITECRRVLRGPGRKTR